MENSDITTGAKKQPGKRPSKIRCPHCQEWAFINQSYRITATLSRWEAVCHNTECLAVFQGSISIDFIKRQSLAPSPDINLPVKERRNALHAEQS